MRSIKQGLYKVPISSINIVQCHKASINGDLYEIFGHLYSFVLNQIPRYMYISLTHTTYDTYSACQLGKSHRLSIFHKHTRSTTSFVIVHVNMWDPIPFSSSRGMKYFLFFVDGYSKLQWIYILHNKTQVAYVFFTFWSHDLMSIFMQNSNVYKVMVIMNSIIWNLIFFNKVAYVEFHVHINHHKKD